jgi:hypothetical protein
MDFANKEIKIPRDDIEYKIRQIMSVEHHYRPYHAML